MPQRPNGLGFLPDGRLLIVSVGDRKLLVHDGSTLRQAADLVPFTHDLCNDMVVDRHGRAYIGDYRHATGADAFERHANACGANLVLADFSGDPERPSCRVVAEDLLVPNGMVVSRDGHMLIVAETGGQRLTAFTIGGDGNLSDRRTWAPLGISPDGLSLDAEGRIWVATPFPPACFQLIEKGGRIVEQIDVAPAAAFAVACGGHDERSLFFLEANFPTQPTERFGRIRVLELAPRA